MVKVHSKERPRNIHPRKISEISIQLIHESICNFIQLPVTYTHMNYKGRQSRLILVEIVHSSTSSPGVDWHPQPSESRATGPKQEPWSNCATMAGNEPK